MSYIPDMRTVKVGISTGNVKQPPIVKVMPVNDGTWLQHICLSFKVLFPIPELNSTLQVAQWASGKATFVMYDKKGQKYGFANLVGTYR